MNVMDLFTLFFRSKKNSNISNSNKEAMRNELQNNHHDHPKQWHTHCLEHSNDL